MNSGVYEESAYEIALKPRVRTYKERANRSAIRDMSAEKAQAKAALMQAQQANLQKLRALEQDGRIDFGTLPIIDPEIREILLTWLSNALEDNGKCARTEEGRPFRLDETCAGQTCVLRASDGCLTMPHFVLVFEEAAE